MLFSEQKRIELPLISNLKLIQHTTYRLAELYNVSGCTFFLLRVSHHFMCCEALLSTSASKQAWPSVPIDIRNTKMHSLYYNSLFSSSPGPFWNQFQADCVMGQNLMKMGDLQIPIFRIVADTGWHWRVKVAFKLFQGPSLIQMLPLEHYWAGPS